jgi:hypothetical protein
VNREPDNLSSHDFVTYLSDLRCKKRHLLGDITYEDSKPTGGALEMVMLARTFRNAAGGRNQPPAGKPKDCDRLE